MTEPSKDCGETGQGRQEHQIEPDGGDRKRREKEEGTGEEKRKHENEPVLCTPPFVYQRLECLEEQRVQVLHLLAVHACRALDNERR